MKKMRDYEIVREQEIPELGARGKWYRHRETGAEILSVETDDENKVFGVTFRTPPADGTGLPHILEHSVLCGSRRYPVKEPFVEALKGSLQTFLNAFTYPDRTCYPVASQNLQDFRNLVDIYLDAVFHPRLSPSVFQQEGWHYELENREGPLGIRGVVLNEMRGAYASPERLLGVWSQSSLFPDTPYRFDSGGDPAEIPELTYERFLEFHRTCYHPSNARFFFYGDDDPAGRFSMIRDYLKDAGRRAAAPVPPVQPPFREPARLVRSYASGDLRGGGRGGYMTVNWLLPETSERDLNFAFHVLTHILIGMPGSPLRKALIDSGLGEDLAGSGLESELRQLIFSAGMRGMDPGRERDLEEVILTTLSRLVREGIDPATVEASLNTVEFRLRENNTGSYPRGLVLMLRALTTWVYDGDPFLLLSFDGPMKKLRSACEKNGRFFEELIRRWLLENPHRTTVLLVPDEGLAEREEKGRASALLDALSGMAPEKRDEIAAETMRLREIQNTPDPPEALASIPVLRLEDLDRRGKTVPLSVLGDGAPLLLFHDIETNGICYIDLAFDLAPLPDDLLPFLPLFGRALLETGTEKEDEIRLSQRISGKTGGIHTAFVTSRERAGKGPVLRFVIRGKALEERVPDLFAIFGDILTIPRLDNRERFGKMVLEQKARMERNIVPSGHQFVNTRLRSFFSRSGFVAERMGGLGQLLFLRDLARKVEEDWPSVHGTLRRIQGILLTGETSLVNVTVPSGSWDGVSRRSLSLAEALPRRGGTPPAKSVFAPGEGKSEGFGIPASVYYVGKGMNLHDAGYRFHGSSRVVARYLRNTWLWDQVRVRGGAYGAFCQYDDLSGVVTLLSYRDPGFRGTLDVFDRAGSHLRKTELSAEELRKGIIGAVGDEDACLLPDARGYASMIRHLTGTTDEYRRKVRDEIFATSAEDFRMFGERLEALRDRGIVQVLGPETGILETAGALGLDLDVRPIL
ncbi:MAG TPA: insulinase family protein [Syntrophales bacterium]|nr:insulinase family protein [Syntrophales bacterium]HQQ27017.1 insulinase family protein [Syntrophales bacterium]